MPPNVDWFLSPQMLLDWLGFCFKFLSTNQAFFTIQYESKGNILYYLGLIIIQFYLMLTIDLTLIVEYRSHYL